ncbi:hypothetical protein LZ30DRAFT_809018 [Colletotrichum cereale]|nr:hypothetical protein LZ30DRAFT_809018 [Colletotrichum cereale]
MKEEKLNGIVDQSLCRLHKPQKTLSGIPKKAAKRLTYTKPLVTTSSSTSLAMAAPSLIQEQSLVSNSFDRSDEHQAKAHGPSSRRASHMTAALRLPLAVGPGQVDWTQAPGCHLGFIKAGRNARRRVWLPLVDSPCSVSLFNHRSASNPAAFPVCGTARLHVEENGHSTVHFHQHFQTPVSASMAEQQSGTQEDVLQLDWSSWSAVPTQQHLSMTIPRYLPPFDGCDGSQTYPAY